MSEIKFDLTLILFSDPTTFTLDKFINIRCIYTFSVDCGHFELSVANDNFYLEEVPHCKK